MKQGFFSVLENTPIAPGVFRMRLRGDTAAVQRPGQFVNIKLDGFSLRRPLSVCDLAGDTFTLVYKMVGGGTEALSGYPVGGTLDVLTGLGNGFDRSKSGDTPLLIGGGLGAAPLFWLCRELQGEGKAPRVLLGFNTREECILEEDFRALGVPVTLATADGSAGVRGFVTDAMDGLDYSYFYACGPRPMFTAVQAKAGGAGQFSFEARMGCGFGACMACSLQTKNGPKRICKEGPVFEREEILWQT